MFDVVEMWANVDSSKERVVSSFPDASQADRDAAERRSSQVFPWSGFVVRARHPEINPSVSR